MPFDNYLHHHQPTPSYRGKGGRDSTTPFGSQQHESFSILSPLFDEVPPLSLSPPRIRHSWVALGVATSHSLVRLKHQPG